MWPFKSKYEKLTREEVNDAICKLENENQKIEEELKSFEVQINELTALAKKENVKEVKLNCIKKISYIKRRRVAIAKRSSYLLYNIELMERLKQAIDDNQMFTLANGISLNKFLSDQKGLRKFLMKSLNIKQDSEKTLVESNDIFDSVDDLYEESEEIYGKSESDDELLAAFEKEEGMLDDVNAANLSNNAEEAAEADVQEGEN